MSKIVQRWIHSKENKIKFLCFEYHKIHWEIYFYKYGTSLNLFPSTYCNICHAVVERRYVLKVQYPD